MGLGGMEGRVCGGLKKIEFARISFSWILMVLLHFMWCGVCVRVCGVWSLWYWYWRCGVVRCYGEIRSSRCGRSHQSKK